MPRDVFRLMVNTVRRLAWEFIRVLSLSHCSSFYCWRRFRVRSALVYQGSFSTLTNGAHRGHPRGVYLQDQDVEGWKVKGSMSTWRKPNSWSLRMYPCAVCFCGFDRNSILCSQYILRVHKMCSDITKRLVEDPNSTAPGVRVNQGPSMAELGLKWCTTMRDVEATFCFLGDTLCSNGALTVPLLPDAVCPGGSSGNSCLP